MADMYNSAGKLRDLISNGNCAGYYYPQESGTTSQYSTWDHRLNYRSIQLSYVSLVI